MWKRFLDGGDVKRGKLMVVMWTGFLDGGVIKWGKMMLVMPKGVRGMR